VLEWLAKYGYVVLFLGLLGEYIAFPFPGDLTLAFAGVLSHQGKLNFWLAGIVGFLGTSIGMSFTYFVGKGLGKPFLLRYGRYVLLSPERIERGMRWIDQFGLPLLGVGYFIPGVRHFTGYLSGAMGIPFRHFAAAAYMGAFAWVAFFLTLGRLLGPKWDVYAPLVEKYAFPLGLALLIVMGIIALGRYAWRPFWLWWIGILREADVARGVLRRLRLFLYVFGAFLAGTFVLFLKILEDLWSQDIWETDVLTFVLVQGALEELPVLYALLPLESLSRIDILFSTLLITSAFVVWRGKERDLELFLLLGALGGTLLGLLVLPRLFAICFGSQYSSVGFAASMFSVLSFIDFAGYLVARLFASLWLRWAVVGVFVALSGGTFFADLAFSNASWGGVVVSGLLGFLWSGVHVVFYEFARAWRAENRKRFSHILQDARGNN